MTDKIYKIDYSAWSKEINANAMPIFNTLDIQKRYVNEWMKILDKQDMLACKDYSDPKMKAQMQKEKIEAPENFQLPINYKSNCMYIHFRVSRIIQMMQLSGITSDDASNTDITEFTDVNRNINWTVTSDNVEIKQQPVIMVPLVLDKYYKWVIIDGNHRITDAIKKKKETIKTICINSNSLVKSNMFCTGFDKCLYIFQNEMVALATLIQKDGYSEEAALKSSYFYSGKVLCYTELP